MMIKKKISMAAWLLVWFCWGMGIGQVTAQYKTDFLLTGLQNEQLKTSVEQSLTALLTEFNTAQAAGRSLQWDAPALQGKLSEQAIASLRALWANSPFRCTETEVIEKCLQTPSGYQVRNIPLIMMPLDKENYQDDLYQELVVNLDRDGTISEVYFSIGMHLYSKVIRSNITVTDLRRRQVILDFVENFRTAYNRKDLPFLGQVFSDDALIITGKQIKSVKNDGGITLDKSFEYKRQTKAEYLANLKGVFSRNKVIKVIFDDIKVVKHPVKDYYYGVTLKQGWRSDTYSDVGYVFLLIDFKDEMNPMIHVRTWQPEKYDDGTEVPESKIFSLSDFEC